MSPYEGLRKQIADLAGQVPKGYRAFDSEGKPIIQSRLPGPEWLRAADKLLRSRGREAEKAELLWKLRHSTGFDGSGGFLYQYVCAYVSGREPNQLESLARQALLDHGCSKRDLPRATKEFLAGFVPPQEETKK